MKVERKGHEGLHAKSAKGRASREEFPGTRLRPQRQRHAALCASSVASRAAREILLALTVALALSACAPQAQPQPQTELPQPGYAELYQRLSEQGGYFDSDNLISNETSYLHALDELRTRGVQGGAYVGVGPDQNFSYIAEIRPVLAFMIDIRRDNMLQHLMFRSLFRRSRNRMEFLAGLIGANLPGDVGRWTGQPIEAILAVLDTAKRTPAAFNRVSTVVLQDAQQSGITLNAQDVETLREFHREFHDYGMEIRYTSKNRPPRLSYPTLRELILERDRGGARSSYLASEDRWRYVQDLQKSNRVLVVTGDLSGEHALRAIGAFLRERDLKISAFYTSNVEQYLFQFGTFPDFAANTLTLPFDTNAVIIRSYFARGRGHPLAVFGHMSVQLVQPAAQFVQKIKGGGYGSYFELVN